MEFWQLLGRCGFPRIRSPLLKRSAALSSSCCLLAHAFLGQAEGQFSVTVETSEPVKKSFDRVRSKATYDECAQDKSAPDTKDRDDLSTRTGSFMASGYLNGVKIIQLLRLVGHCPPRSSAAAGSNGPGAVPHAGQGCRGSAGAPPARSPSSRSPKIIEIHLRVGMMQRRPFGKRLFTHF